MNCIYIHKGNTFITHAHVRAQFCELRQWNTKSYRGENVNISFGIKLKQYGNVNGFVSHETERRAGRLMDEKENGTESQTTESKARTKHERWREKKAGNLFGNRNHIRGCIG